MITFREERRNGDVIEHKIASDEVLLSEVLEQFEYFLKGCSYVFDGHVDIINEEEDNEPLYVNDNMNFDTGPGHVGIDTHIINLTGLSDSDNIDLLDVGHDHMFTGAGGDYASDMDVLDLSMADTITLDLTDTYGTTTTTLKDD
jgi:hypothetical protein